MKNSLNPFRTIHQRLTELERRFAGTLRNGTVAEVNAAKKTVRLKIGGTDERPFLSPPIPYAQIAGDLKLHSMPSIGQQMTMIAANGDRRQAIAIPMQWSDANPSPSDNQSEHVLTFGNVRITLVDGGLKFQVGGTVVDITGSGVKITASAVEVDGQSVKHNSVEIGFQHRHEDVTVGGDKTGYPEG